MILDRLNTILTTGYTVTGYDMLLFCIIYALMRTIVDTYQENKK